MSGIIIKASDQIDRTEWEKFVVEHPEGTVFQLPGFYDSCLKTKKYSPVFLAVKDHDGYLCGLFLAVIQQDYYFPFSYFTRRTIAFGGPLIRDNNTDILELILDEIDLICNKRSIYIQFRNFYQQDNSIKNVFERKGYKYQKHLNILVDLKVGKEALWKGVKRNRKDGINKAKKQDFVFEVSDELDCFDDFYKLLKITYRDIKLPYPHRSFFHALNNEMRGHLKWFILKKNNMPIIVLASFVYDDTIYAFYIGISRDSELLKLRPVDLFYWQVLKWGAENNLKTFDWMGAGSPDKDYGVRKFKLQYGGEVYEMGRYEKTYSSLSYKLASFFYNYWKKLK